MELEIAITGVIGLFILGLIGYKSLSKYLTHEGIKVTNDQKAHYENQILTLTKNYESMENSRDGYRQKYKFMQKNYDIELDDDDEISEDGEVNDIIPEIAGAIWPKMPPKIKELLGKEEFQDAIFKVAEKNVDKIPDWIEKFVTKPKEGSTSNNSKVLTETYL